jgi:hypothetical protein
VSTDIFPNKPSKKPEVILAIIYQYDCILIAFYLKVNGMAVAELG